ncbi:MAG TPA: zinc-binding dehydrogenase, partial [Stellaceae bacterium]|nr:zinc-binding dehydrogenase [Stellaceae bacterium]
AALHVAGQDMSGAAVFDGVADPHPLPHHPWQRERHWFTRTGEATAPLDPAHDHPLLGFRQGGALPSWLNHVDAALFPALADHRLAGTPVLPAAAIIDMALAAARVRHPDAAALELRDLELLRPLVLADGETRELRAALLSPDGDWQLASRRRLAEEPFAVHATARLDAAPAGPLLPAPPPAGIAGETIDAATLYRRAARLGLDYGDAFRRVAAVTLAEGGRADVALTPDVDGAPPGHLIDPALLDAAFQGLLALAPHSDGGGEAPRPLVPRSCGRIRAFAPFGRRPERAELRLRRVGRRGAAADVALYDAGGAPLVELGDCWFAAIDLAPAAGSAARILRVDLLPAPLGPAPPPAVLERLASLVGEIAARRRDAARDDAQQALLLDALVAAICRDAVAAAADLEQVAQIEPRLLSLLRRFGAAEQQGGRWRLTDDHPLPDAGELWRSMLADGPELVVELTAAAMLRDALPGRLRDVAAPDATSPALQALRRAGLPVAVARAVLADILAALAAAWPRDRPLRLCLPEDMPLPDGMACDGLAVSRVATGEPCDIAVLDDPAAAERLSGLLPGGAALGIAPLPNPLWDMLFADAADARMTLTAAGLELVAAAPAAMSPWPCAVIAARCPYRAEAALAQPPLALAVLVEGADPGLAAALQAAGHALVPETAADAVILALDGTGGSGGDAASLLPRLAGLAARCAGRGVPLWLVTAGAHQPGVAASPLAAALWSFARVLVNETPGLCLRAVDLPSGTAAAGQAERIVQELAAAGREGEIVWTPVGRHVLRVRPGLPVPQGGAQGGTAAVDLVARCEPPGSLDRLAWHRLDRRRPGPGEIEIEVRAAGLNFRDVMVAGGMLPEAALLDGLAGSGLGLECAGIVRALGEEVRGIAVGDRVAGFAPDALASRAVTSAAAVIRIPDGLGFAAAATLPVAFVTASYALDMLARVAPGEHVLIHAASGGLGLAAIQIAKQRGAIVVATAGSPVKRAFLRLVGADHVCDSRGLGFVAAVRQATGGSGVDVVLNSLHGAAAEASLELLKPFGRFVELGKRDLVENRPLRTRPLRRNISYFTVDVDQLAAERPSLARRLLAELAAALAAGAIRPLAHRAFAFAELADAFRLMQAAQHVGKLVLVPGEAGRLPVAVAPPPGFALHPDGCYVVTGGLAGFGFAAARWLAGHGARRLALIGRRGAATPGAAERVAELAALGAVVSVHAADVADAAALAA